MAMDINGAHLVISTKYAVSFKLFEKQKWNKHSSILNFVDKYSILHFRETSDYSSMQKWLIKYYIDICIINIDI
jgi:hypothetical protein